MKSKDGFTIEVYIDNGVVFYYTVATAHKAREHASAIINGGYRHSDGSGELEWYPPHRILKVKIVGTVPTNYTDKVRGT